LAAEEMRPERIGMPRQKYVAPRSARRDEEKSAPGGGIALAPAAGAPREAEAEGRAQKGAAEKAADPFAEPPPPMAARARNAAPGDDIGANDGIGALADRAGEAKRKEESSGAGGPATPAATAPKDPYAAAMELYSAGRYAEADHAFSEVAASGAKNAANAALYSAKSTEAAYGCGRAAAKYESVAARFAGTSAAAEGQWGAANCYKLSGNLDRAYALYKDLRSVAGYRDRAEGELENLKILQQQNAAKASRAAPAKPAAPPPNATAVPPNAAPKTQPAQ
ncbi:MAG: hypothetical protein ABW133_06410, partial [Polyangiaceae bacterium]